MRILGIDFATSPSRRAPMFVVSGSFDGDVLNLDKVESYSENVLAEVLKRPGPWVLGLDVPFGLPAEFLESKGWSLDWAEYVRHVAGLSWAELKSEIEIFRSPRPVGSKDLYRPCDRAAGSLSPIKTVLPPLARMFQVAAPMLLASECDALPLRRNGRDRTVVEVYPKLVARRLVKAAYKTSDPGKAPTTAIRRQMIDRLGAGDLTDAFGFSVLFSDTVREAAIQNEPGEAIDSVLSAIEAAWSLRNRDRNWGIPTDGAAESGWIVDPELVVLPKPGEPVVVRVRSAPKDAKGSRVDMPRFHQAMVYAAAAHSTQKRKGTEIPYVSHLLIVAGLVLEFGGDEDEAIAGLLHDAVEDAGGQPRLNDIRLRFGSRVAEIVDACTDADVIPKPPWRERKERYLKHLQHASPSTRLVSASDKLANVRSILKDYRSIGESLWTRFNGGREGTLWYYRALAEAFERLGPASVAAEVADTLRALERLLADAPASV